MRAMQVSFRILSAAGGYRYSQLSPSKPSEISFRSPSLTPLMSAMRYAICSGQRRPIELRPPSISYLALAITGLLIDIVVVQDVVDLAKHARDITMNVDDLLSVNQRRYGVCTVGHTRA